MDILNEQLSKDASLIIIIKELKTASAPWRVADLGYLDDIIDPRDTRKEIIKSLKLARGKSKGFSKRRLANWLTIF